MTGLKNIRLLPLNRRFPGIFCGVVFVAVAILFVGNVQAQNPESDKKEVKPAQFIDEDGDGFNDLLPDADGDGIPNLIDPDFKGHSAESLYMYRYMHGQTMEAERERFQHMYQHGEPGQYGPADSTGHGQGGEGQGGHHGGPGGGMTGMSQPDSGRVNRPGDQQTNGPRPEYQGNKENEGGRPEGETGVKQDNSRNREKEKGSGSHGGGGGRP